MDFREIRQLSRLEGTNRNPNSNEDGKFLKWNNTSGYIEYSKIGDGGDSDINTTYFNNYINSFLTSTSTDDYINGISRVENTARFTYNSGKTPLDLPLGSLAWENTVEATLSLPGDTEILFDENGSIGGSENFTYNRLNGKVQFKVPLMFNTTEGTYKEGVSYLGNYSWSIGAGLNSSASGNYNILSGYQAGNGLGTSSLRNTIYGAYAGEAAGNDLEGSIFIGAYAGRQENTSNKFYLDNTSYTDVPTARSSSFLYADLDTERRLYIRDRLSVEKEGKFGYSGLNDASGEYGMYQMSAASGGEPQWHDGTTWQTFASSTNTYLNDYDLTNSDLTLILSDLSEVGPIDLSGINTITFATSPSSPATGKVTSDFGYLQISNSSFTDNEGFTYKTGLRWSDSTNTLSIPGGINLATSSGTGYGDNTIWSDGSHVYAKIASSDVQLDNIVGTGEANTASNVGLSGTGVFKQKSDYDLEFKNLHSTDARINVIDNTGNDEINFTLSLVPAGNNITPSTSLTYTGEIFTSVTSPDGQSPTYNFKKLISDTVAITNSGDELRLEVTGIGGGEANTGANLGSGIEVYKQTTAPILEFKTITADKSGAHITASANADGLHVDLDVDDIGTNFLGTGEQLFTMNANLWDSDQKGLLGNTTQGLTLTNSTTDITINQTISIPAIGTSPNTFSSGTPSIGTGSKGTLNFNIDFASDVRNGQSLVQTTFFSINIGDGLLYDSANNTLYSNASSGAGSAGDVNDYRLTGVDNTTDNDTASNYVRQLTISNGVGDTENVFNLTIPKSPISKATYTDNASPLIGGVLVDKSSKVWTSGTTQQLVLDELTGTLSVDSELVTYDTQNELLDQNNTGYVDPIIIGTINTKRLQARANIGAAYAQGDGTIDFFMNNSYISGAISAGVNPSTTEHEIGNLTIQDQTIHAETTSAIVIEGNDGGYNSAATVSVGSGDVTIQFGDQPQVGKLVVKDKDGVSIMVVDNAGNLYVKGNIYSDGEIEAFSDDTTV